MTAHHIDVADNVPAQAITTVMHRMMAQARFKPTEFRMTRNTALRLLAELDQTQLHPQGPDLTLSDVQGMEFMGVPVRITE